MDKKCTVEWLSNQPNKAKARCGRQKQTWTRSYAPSPFTIRTIDGEWKNGLKTLRLSLTEGKWNSAELEEGALIYVYKAEWAGGFEGKKFYLRNPQDDSVVIGHIVESGVEITLNGKKYLFTQE